eukprot:9494312-Pyramimonas_sp.AAC.1
MIDSTKRQVWTFDPMGHIFEENEEKLIKRAFRDHTYKNLNIRVQGEGDKVKCGIWVIWVGREWLSDWLHAGNWCNPPFHLIG